MIKDTYVANNSKYADIVRNYAALPKLFHAAEKEHCNFD